MVTCSGAATPCPLPRVSGLDSQIDQITCAINGLMTGPVHFRTSDELGVESVVHFRGKLTAVVSERGECMFARPSFPYP